MLSSLKSMSVVVADTGDYSKIQQYRPQDATTNPTLILQAVQSVEYAALVDRILKEGNGDVDDVCDRLAVGFGVEILKLIPGRVSTEVDAALSFDAGAMVEKAHKLISLYKQAGIEKDRVLIKLASTWEGIEACRQLQSEGINCNMTLIFNYHQALACAQAGARLISPFVGRILDWYAKNDPKSTTGLTKLTDPGVVCVTRIFEAFKACKYETTVMAASFRSVDQILGLAGIDSLTISPKLLAELEAGSGEVEQVLFVNQEDRAARGQEKVDEAMFRWEMNEDVMATEKLAEGIRNFNKDSLKLKQVVKEKLS